MKIFVSAAEISSDIQAEKIVSSVIREYQKNFPGFAIEVFGIGGPKLRAIPGFKCIEPAESLRAMGFGEIIGKLSHIKAVLTRAVRAIENEQPDLILTFDYPDFHLRLIRALKKHGIASQALKICGIPPKVWVWRSHRVEQIRELYDGVWVILPFEKSFYESKGIPVIYEGNPLIADLFAREKNKIPSGYGLNLALMPGSREAELNHHLPVVAPTLRLLSDKIRQPVNALIPVPAGVSFDRLKAELISDSKVNYHFVENGTLDVLSSADLGLIKSGTSTLEAAVLGCVPVIFYKVGKITEWIFKFIMRYTGPVGLPNILLGIHNRKNVVFTELLGPEATPESLSSALAELALNAELLATKKVKALQLKEALVPQAEIPTIVANRILSWLQVRPYKDAARKRSLLVFLGSFLWSSINFLRRYLYRAGMSRAVKTDAESILVGNLQAGGAGKTPVVMAIAKEAIRRGKKVAVVSRGYGSRSENEVTVVSSDARQVSADQVGDEPAEIKRNVPEVVLGIGSNRRKVLDQLPEVDLVIYDDGFQNLSFTADQTVLCVTDRSRSEVFYRDFDSQKKYADLILNVQSMEWVVAGLPVTPIWLLCGVGDPQAVVSFYSKRGVTIKRLIAKPDHAHFDESEIASLIEDAAKMGCILAVTEKDHVKLGDKFPTLFVLKRELRSADWIQALF
jgi:lipid-A-disaccharide synthase